MSNHAGKPKTKRPSKGQRAHVRRLKQEAKKAGAIYRKDSQ